MKTFHLVSLLSIVIVVALMSCSKQTDSVTPGSTPTTVNPTPTTPTSTSGQVSFKVKVDGADYAPDFAYALASFPGANGYFAIYGLDSKTNNVVAMALPNTAVEGTYPISDVNFGIATFNKQDYSTINAGAGTITITKKTATYMTGTFSFTAYDATATKKLALTEGAFNVNIR